MQLLDGKLKSVPLNTIAMVDMENSEKYQLWFEKVKQKIVELAQQVSDSDYKLRLIELLARLRLTNGNSTM